MIYKVAGVICRDRAILAVRKAGDPSATLILPGGKPEPDETPLETLARELKEELDVGVRRAALFGETSARSALDPDSIRMTVFDVEIAGEPRPSGEIGEMMWLGRDAIGSGLAMGSVLETYVMPELIRQGRL